MQVRQVPLTVVAGLAVLGSVGFLAWHQFARDDNDEAWLDPGQPPAQMALPLVPLQHGCGSPMSCSQGFRSRGYPDTMATLSAVVAGEV